MSDEYTCVGYGTDDDCMVFNSRCKCGRFLRMPPEMKYAENGAGNVKIISTAECAKCGTIDLNDNFEGFY